MKIKRFMAPLLALALSFALAAPAFAAPVPPEVENVQSTDADAPRYAVYEVPFRAYLDGLTYLDVTFTVAYKSGRYVFESVDSVALTPMNASALHWELVGYTSQLSSTECTLTISRKEMVGNTPTGAFHPTDDITIKIEAVMGSARENGPVILSLDTAALAMKIEAVMGIVRESGFDTLASVHVVIDETYGFAGEPKLVRAE